MYTSKWTGISILCAEMRLLFVLEDRVRLSLKVSVSMRDSGRRMCQGQGNVNSLNSHLTRFYVPNFQNMQWRVKKSQKYISFFTAMFHFTAFSKNNPEP